MNAAIGKDSTPEDSMKSRESDNEWSVDYANTVVDIICAECGLAFQRKARRGHTPICCSRLCVRRRNCVRANAALRALYPQSGEGNFNFRGWASKQSYAYTKRFRAANPEQVRTQRVVASAVRRGVLVRPDVCAACYAPCRVDAHHEDYTRPLRVEWLCRKCHVARNRARVARLRAHCEGS
jgi:hypothetical protein